MVKLYGKVNNQAGLTSRLCADLVAEANRALNCNIRLICNDEVADLKSIMNMMSLIIKSGQEFVIEIDGKDEENVKNKFTTLLTNLNLLK